MTHPLGRFVLEWPISSDETRIATYAVTGKKNDVYVEASHLPCGKWMHRHAFEHWVEATINQLGGTNPNPKAKRPTGASRNPKVLTHDCLPPIHAIMDAIKKTTSTSS